MAVAFLKMVASALTIGTGAAAGDFAPSMVIGGLLEAAFGLSTRLVLHDPSIDPAAFALVGMGTFYGGLAHAPLAALVMVSELAGSYDLLVPMMLAIGIAYVALRHYTLYPAQRASRAAAEVAVMPRGGALFRAVAETEVASLMVPLELAPVEEDTLLATVAKVAEAAKEQRVLVVVGPEGPKGLVELDLVADVTPSDRAWMRASDSMVPFASLRPRDTFGPATGPPRALWGLAAPRPGVGREGLGPCGWPGVAACPGGARWNLAPGFDRSQELLLEHLEDGDGALHLSGGEGLEQGARGRLDGPGHDHIQGLSAPGEMEEGSAAVIGIGSADEQPTADEPLHELGEGARVHVEDSRQVARGDLRVAAHEAHHHALGPGDAEALLHPSGRRLHPVVHAPERAQKLERRSESVSRDLRAGKTFTCFCRSLYRSACQSASHVSSRA